MSDQQLARVVDQLASNIYELVVLLRQLTQEVEILTGYVGEMNEKNNHSG